MLYPSGSSGLYIGEDYVISWKLFITWPIRGLMKAKVSRHNVAKVSCKKKKKKKKINIQYVI